jgi:phage-related protein
MSLSGFSIQLADLGLLEVVTGLLKALDLNSTVSLLVGTVGGLLHHVGHAVGNVVKHVGQTVGGVVHQVEGTVGGVVGTVEGTVSLARPSYSSRSGY